MYQSNSHTKIVIFTIFNEFKHIPPKTNAWLVHTKVKTKKCKQGWTDANGDEDIFPFIIEIQ